MNSSKKQNMNDHHPLRRAAPPARPHPIAGYRAQHHHHSQRAIQAAGIDPLELQRGLHPTNAFARLDHNTLSRILSFISPIQLLTTLNRTSKTLNRLINQHDNHLLWNTKLDWLTNNPLTSHTLPSIININPDNLENLFSHPLLGPPFQQDGKEEEDLLSFDPAPSSQYPSIYPGKITNTTKARILTYKPHHHHSKATTTRKTTDYRGRFLAYYRSLLPYLDSLIEHSTDSLVFLIAGLSPLQRAELLAVLSRLLRNPALAPPRLLLNKTLHDNLNKALCAFHRALYNQFSLALNTNRLSDLNTLACVNAALPPLLLPSSGLGIPDIARCFIDKRVIFEHQPFNPLDNLRKREGLKGEQIEGVDFSAMARFFEYISETIEREGGLIQRIFPRQMNVLERLISRIIDEVIEGYVARLLTAVQSLPSPLFQITNVEVYRHLKGLVEATKKVDEDGTGRTTGRVEEMIQRMFGAHLAVYLEEELSFVKGALEQACSRWQEAGELMEGSQVGGSRGAGLTVPSTRTTDGSLGTKTKTAVLRSFKNALLLPVSVVPKTVSYSFNALSNVGVEAFHSVTHALILPSTTSIHTHGPLSTDYRHAKILRDQPSTLDSELESWLDCSPPNPSLLLPTPSSSSSSNPITHPSLINPKSTLTNRDQKQEEDELDDRDGTEPDDELSSLLSLDLVLQLITINQQAIQRLHSFLPFAPLQSLNLQIVNTVHQVFVLLLHSLTHHHIQPGFEKAFRIMSSYASPSKKEVSEKSKKKGRVGKEEGKKKNSGGGGGGGVANFFGMMDVADTIQEMVEVYSEQALGADVGGHQQTQDFLSPIGREKRAFERAIDGWVAHGMSLTIDAIVMQLDLRLRTLQLPSDFCPPPNSSSSSSSCEDDDGLSSSSATTTTTTRTTTATEKQTKPTPACTAVVDRLLAICNALQGRSDRQVLHVFYQELGLRIHALLCKHIKRTKISIEGAHQLETDIARYAQVLGSMAGESKEGADEGLHGSMDALRRVGRLFGCKTPAQLVRFIRHLGLGMVSSGSTHLQLIGSAVLPMSIDELYQFVQARDDWNRIQDVVEAELFGFGGGGGESCVLV
ncbi:uncharacterized protein PGTG_01415 [Puccinia graminis f. sp. tritici CRL 75-36-700-3]|uniref:F-box domain-containing protein n=1 Tax=Puccinia graminis f. sp. tritici (strain CRL 75-36-700-3 / race SCCL) TaxID=418459 RepID=E3JRZ7_PUCGT|nr:uncharacterized protein PGTG_01415 [Puccinia graminis f. sp. tritici CRL 75-36-700-3]EFP74822.2 hypothetical protein PGTG_01415 [Puccinia graminis f. sp. tritici CRL 75-36-700-3]